MEGLGGVVLMVTTLPGVFALRVTGGVGMGTVVLVLLSSAAHLVQVRASSRAREDSAGQRLYTSIKFGSDDGPAEEGATEPEESPAAPEELPEGEGEPSGA